jgi:hypothetical protein
VEYGHHRNRLPVLHDLWHSFSGKNDRNQDQRGEHKSYGYEWNGAKCRSRDAHKQKRAAE